MLYVGDEVPEEIPAHSHQPCPQKSTEDVIKNKILVFHASSSGHDRSESANHGHEPGQDYGLLAVFLIKSGGLIQVSAIEEKRVGIGKNFWPQLLAGPVPHAVSQHGRKETPEE